MTHPPVITELVARGWTVQRRSLIRRPIHRPRWRRQWALYPAGQTPATAREQWIVETRGQVMLEHATYSTGHVHGGGTLVVQTLDQAGVADLTARPPRHLHDAQTRPGVVLAYQTSPDHG